MGGMFSIWAHIFLHFSRIFDLQKVRNGSHAWLNQNGLPNQKTIQCGWASSNQYKRTTSSFVRFLSKLSSKVGPGLLLLANRKSPLL